LKSLIIIGGGLSIEEGLSKGLKERLKDKYVFTLNYAYKHFDNATAEIFVDNVFYNEQIEQLKKLPLIIGQSSKDIIKVLPNSILFKNSNKYIERDISQGVYKSQLCGLWAITIALYLLDEGDEIYLLGYDGGKISEEIVKRKWLTHYYQKEGKIKHRGVGHLGYYNTKDQSKRDYGVYANEKKVKIWNVSLNSKIPTFEKISYDEFFKKLDNKTYDQNFLRNQIKERLK
jgi:hypothetical protein